MTVFDGLTACLLMYMYDGTLSDYPMPGCVCAEREAPTKGIPLRLSPPNRFLPMPMPTAS